MNIPQLINALIAAGNRYATQEYLNFYQPDAVLDDPSVGRKFTGHKGIKNYFVSYFIGYETQTKIMKLVVQDDTHAHLKVAFTGTFPEGHIEGTFDFTFKEGKIAFAKADLVH
jgi:ketosteroid isomerase-like protein